MPPSRFTSLEWDEMHERAHLGESLTTLARERGMSTSNMSRLLRRRYGYRVPPERLLGRKPQTIGIPTDPAQLGYIAGIVDGEGNISIGHGRMKAAVVVRVGMTDEPVIRWLAQMGGSVTTYVPPAPRKRVWTWSVFRQSDAAPLLVALLPHLIVKADRAREALAELGRRDAATPTA